MPPPAAARRSLPLRKKLLFSALIVLGLPLLAEGLARLVHGWNRHWVDCHRPHPTLGWTLRENWAGKWNWVGGYARINAQGLRDDDDLRAKEPGEKRLLCLGDSVTFGAKVKTAEAFPQRLQSLLPGWRVLNGGVSSYDPSQEADWLREVGLPLQPDLLLVQFCRNDLDASPRGRHPLAQAHAATGWLTEHSLLAFKLHRAFARLAALGHDPQERRGPKTERGGWPLVEKAYRQIAADAAERHLPVVLVIFPHRDVVLLRGEERLSQQLRDLAGDLGWSAVDLHAAFQASPATQWYLPDDPIHPSAAGYALAAETIAAALRPRLAASKE